MIKKILNKYYKLVCSDKYNKKLGFSRIIHNTNKHKKYIFYMHLCYVILSLIFFSIHFSIPLTCLFMLIQIIVLTQLINIMLK